MKEDKKLIQTMVFDDYGYAQSIKEESQKKIEKVKKGMIVAAIVTALSVIGFVCMNSGGDALENIGLVLFFLAFPGAIASYIVGGGFSIAFKFAKKLAVFGWFICPFPVDIFTGVITLIIAILAFLFVPLIFVFLNYRQQRKNLDEAEEYISHFKPAGEVNAAGVQN